MARAVHAARDPAWTADGLVSERWLPVSPVSGQLDAFQWKVPLEELAAPAVDATAQSAALRAVIGAPPPPKPVRAEPPVESKPAAPPPEVAPAPAAPLRAAASTAKRPRKPKAETVIPLVHAPDDPGPEAEPEQEPVSGQSPENWDKSGRIFK
jgi:HemY protein